MKNIILYIALIISFFSCQKVLELNAKTKTTKLVVNSLFNDQERWEVWISRSLSVLDQGNLDVLDNATVSIFNGTTLVTNLIYDGEKYIALGLTNTPTLGIEYRVEVSAPNYKSVSAKDFCPSRVSILSIDTSLTIGSSGEKEYTATINFQDPANTENHYGIELDIEDYSRIYNSTTGVFDTTFNGNQQIYMTSTDASVSAAGTEDYVQTLVFKDNLFEGQQKSISVNYNFYDSGDPNQFHVRKLKLISFTESTYNYSKSIQAYRATEGNPFAEPVQVYSNVENGFGIFGGRSSSEIEF